MAALAAALLIVALSALIVHVAAVALHLTGITQDLARFQAMTAFTGVGYTTAESESVMNHPVRRRIIVILMILGNAGIVSILTTLMLSFMNTGVSGVVLRVLVLLVGLGLIVWLASTRRQSGFLTHVMQHLLKRWARIDITDYLSLLRLGDDYQAIQWEVRDEDWMCDRELAELGLRREGILVLGIDRANGNHIGVPGPHTRIQAGDRLALYGREDDLQELRRRRRDAAGESAHRKAVEEQRQREEKQKQEEGEAGPSA